MATLTQLTLDADGTIDTVNIDHDAGTGSPYFSHCNDAPDGNSSDWVANDNGETSGKARFRLTNVNSNFSNMDTLNIDVDVWAETAVDNDTITLTCRIFDADDEVTPLTNETGNIATHADTIRIQRNVTFGGLTGTKAQWDGAYIQFTWTYNKTGGPDNANLRLYGCDIDGTYSIFTPVANAFRFYDDDGDEAGSTPLAAQDTDVNVNAAGADDIVHLRLRVDETTGGSGSSGDDWQLQSKLNAGSWLDVTGSSSNVKAAAGAVGTLTLVAEKSEIIPDVGSSTAGDVTLPGTPLEDDIVIILFGSDGVVTSAMGITETGYIEIFHDTGTSTGNDYKYKVMGATPDTVVEITSVTDKASIIVIQVWRGQDLTTPIDATRTTNTTASGSMPNCPSYDTVTDGTLVFAAGIMDNENELSVTVPTGYSNLIFDDAGAVSGSSCTIMLSSKVVDNSGTEDPGIYGGSETDSTIGTTVGLRAASSGGGSQLTNGAATTDRATNGISNPGGGSFVAGEQESGNGLIEDSQLTANNFTEHVWALVLVSADLVNTDTLEFRLRLNGGAVTTVGTPTITIGTGGSTTGQAVSVTHTIAITDVSTKITRVFTSIISHSLAASTALITIRVLTSPIDHGLAVFPIRKISVFKAVTHTVGGASTRLVKLFAKAVAHAIAVTTSRINIRSFVSSVAHSTSVTSAKFVRLIAKAVTHSVAVALVKTIKLPRAVAHTIAASTVLIAIRNFTSTITHTIGVTVAKANFFSFVSNIAHSITVSTLTPTLRFFAAAVSHAIAATLVKRIRFTKTVGISTAATSVKLVKLLAKAITHTITVATVRANFFTIVSSITHAIAASTSSVITRVFTSVISHATAVALVKKIGLIRAVTHTTAVASVKLVRPIAKAISHTITVATTTANKFLISSPVTHTATVSLVKTIKMAKAIGHSIAAASTKVVKISRSVAHSVAIGATEVASFFSASSVTHTIGVVTGSVLSAAQSVAVGISHVASLATLFIDGGGGGPVFDKLHRRLRAWRKMFN